MKRILWISDGVVPTGFSRVAHSIIGNLPEEKYEVHHLAVNYFGDPHPYTHKIYPAASKANIYGLNRISEFKSKDIDGIFILNDLWVINMYIEEIKKTWGNEVPPIVLYFPVDAEEFDLEWFQHFDVVKQAVVYTEFGLNVVKAVFPSHDFKVIPHGVATDIFYPLSEDKQEYKKTCYPDKPEFYDGSFIVLNVNRNQPRKRLDIALEGFSLFVKDKPENVKYYHHAGLQDVGWNILKLAKRFGMDGRIILTNMEIGVQKVSDIRLNQIYNGCDVGLNTSMGEGWGLPNVEHAATGAVQLVPNHSACRELFEDCGLLIPISQHLYFERILTKGYLIKPEDVAEGLQILYDNKNVLETLSKKCYEKFSSEEYKWKNIVPKWDEIFSNVFRERATLHTQDKI